MFSKGHEFARKIESIKKNLQMDNNSPNHKILKEIIESIREDENALETLDSIRTYRDLFELFTIQQVGRLVYTIAFEEDQTNPIVDILLNGKELMSDSESWSDPALVRQYLLDLTNYMYKNDLKKVNEYDLKNIFGKDVDAVQYIFTKCGLIDKDIEGNYGFKSDEFRAYMNANITLKATVELARKYQ